MQVQIDDPNNRAAKYRMEQDKAFSNPQVSVEDRFMNDPHDQAEFYDNNTKKQNFVDDINDEQIQKLMRARETLGPANEEISNHIDDS